MTRATHSKSFTALALAVSLCGLLLPLTFHPSSARTNAGAQPCPTCVEPTLQTIYAPAIELPEASGSELVLNCRSPQEMDVTPTFYTAEGVPVVGQTVRLQPAEIRFVDIETLMPEEHRRRHRWGGMSLSYRGRTREAWAQITMLGAGKSGSSVDETFSVLQERGSNVQDAVWWMPEKGTAVIALGNSSDAPIRVNLQYSDDESEDVDIAPFATEYVRRRAGNDKGALSQAGGKGESVRLSTTGPAGSLRVAGFVTSGEQNFTSSIRFYDSQAAAQPNLFATRLRLKDGAPRMVLKNTGVTTISARPRFLPASGESGNPVELSMVVLKPRETVDVDLSPLVASSASRADFDVVSAQVVNTGPAGSLIGALYSVDAVTGTIYDVPLRDVGPLRNSTGAYPWRVDGDYSTVVSITNISDTPAQFAVDIFYEGGKYVLNPRQLAVGETALFDLKKMRDERKPDRNGNVIPRSATVGQFHWSMDDGGDTPSLIGRAEVVSVARRVSSSYSCPMCCPDSFYDGIFGPTSIVVATYNSFAQISVTKRTQSCYGTIYGPYAASASWWASDTSVTSVSMVQTGTAKADGLAAGESSIQAGITGTKYFSTGSYCYSTTGYSAPSGNVSVRTPHHLIVQNDLYPLTSSGCPVNTGVVERHIIFTVVDNSTPPRVVGVVPLKEQYLQVTQNTCGNGQPTPFACIPYSDAAGQFRDILTVNCNSVGGSCGYDLQWQWQWCPPGRPAVALGTLTGTIHNNAITVNGHTTPMQQGTQIFP